MLRYKIRSCDGFPPLRPHLRTLIRKKRRQIRSGCRVPTFHNNVKAVCHLWICKSGHTSIYSRRSPGKLRISKTSPTSSMTHSDFIHNHAPFRGARTGSWNYPCSVTKIHVSSHCIHRQLSKCMSDADISEGFTNVYGSFTATIPAADWMRSSLKIKIPVQGKQRHAASHWDNDTPPDSPLSFSQTDSCRSPSITRTSLPPDPAWDESPRKPPAETQKLHPVLEGLERKSRVSCSSQCSTCLKSGRDFPRCGRCGQMWCSRDCRLQGGKKHICPSRRD